MGVGSAHGRAWEYHNAADTLLHTRIEGLLICHAFLVVAYVQLASADNFHSSPWMHVTAGAIVALAVVITILVVRVNHALLKGITYLKNNHLAHDDTYSGYLEAVGKVFLRTGNGSRVLAIWIPVCFLLFWIGIGIQLAMITKAPA